MTFELRCDNTTEEERVLLIGSEPALGNWTPVEAVEMSTSTTEWPIWSATVSLPAGQIVEYKYAISTKSEWNATAFGFNATGARVAGELAGASGVAAAALRRYGGKVKNVTSAAAENADLKGDTLNGTSDDCSKNSGSGGNSTDADDDDVLEDWQFVRDGLVFDWEEGGNHLLKVGRRPHTVADEFLPPLRNPDPIPPSFVHGGLKSECFMDAEYSYIPHD